MGGPAKRDELRRLLRDPGWTCWWWGLSDRGMVVVFSWASWTLASDRRWEVEGVEWKYGRDLVVA